jgi:cystathionine gamma-synthase
MSKRHIATAAAQAGIGQDPTYGAVTPPLYLSSTYALSAFQQPSAYDYSRTNNPTRDLLAQALIELEQGAAAIVTNSGMSACLLVLQLLAPTDTLVIPHDCYGGSYRLFINLAQKKQAFKLQIVNFQQADWAEKLRFAEPKLIWLETPSNPLLQITDIQAVCEFAQTLAAKVVVDNTFLSPILQQPLLLGADIVLHSTTKYLNGHSDVVGGAIICADLQLGQELAWWANCLGLTAAAFDSYMALRGIRTLQPRIQLQQQNAVKVVAFLVQQPLVAKVYYPGLADHPGHAIAQRQQHGFGAMCSFELAADASALSHFFAALTLFTLAQSLGGVESLICHPSTMTHASMDAKAQAAAGLTPSLIRISVGIEQASDLLADLAQGFTAVAKHEPSVSKAGFVPVQSSETLPINPALNALW